MVQACNKTNIGGRVTHAHVRTAVDRVGVKGRICDGPCDDADEQGQGDGADLQHELAVAVSGKAIHEGPLEDLATLESDGHERLASDACEIWQ